VQTLLTLSGNTSAWQQASADLSHLAGQTIQLQFLAQTDGTLVSDFFVDNVELTACDVNQNNWQFLPFTVR
jgi:bacillopeptidase F (M6 metalloprotease family)